MIGKVGSLPTLPTLPTSPTSAYLCLPCLPCLPLPTLPTSAYPAYLCLPLPTLPTPAYFFPLFSPLFLRFFLTLQYEAALKSYNSSLSLSGLWSGRRWRATGRSPKAYLPPRLPSPLQPQRRQGRMVVAAQRANAEPGLLLATGLRQRPLPCTRAEGTAHELRPRQSADKTRTFLPLLPRHAAVCAARQSMRPLQDDGDGQLLARRHGLRRHLRRLHRGAVGEPQPHTGHQAQRPGP